MFTHAHTLTSHMQEGLSKVLPQAERSSYGKELFDVEEKARAARKNVWEDYVEPQPQEDEGEVEGAGEEEQQGPPPERKCDYQKVWKREIRMRKEEKGRKEKGRRRSRRRMGGLGEEGGEKRKGKEK